jgi:hypothetical protein
LRGPTVSVGPAPSVPDFSRPLPVELPLACRKHAGERAVLVNDTYLVLVELHDLEVTLHRGPRLLQKLIQPRMLELRHAQVVELDCDASERLNHPAHPGFQNPHEAALSPQESPFRLRDM